MSKARKASVSTSCLAAIAKRATPAAVVTPDASADPHGRGAPFGRLRLVLLLALAVGVLAPASASAHLVHKFEFSFNGSGTPTGSFSRVGQVAIEQGSGDIWVVEWGAGVVYKFDAAGNYTGVEITGAAVPQETLNVTYEQGIAVDNSGGVTNGDLYLASENGVVYEFDSSGELLAEINGSETPAESFRPRGVAVDSSGDLYVADQSNEVVDKFDPSGKYLSQISSPDIEGPLWLAIDSSFNLYLGNFFNDTVKFEPGGEVSVLDTNQPEAVGVDPASDHVFVSEPIPGQIAEYDSAGNRLDVFGAEQFSYGGHLLGVAVRGSTGEAYVADYEHERIDVFGPAVVVPDVTTERPANVQPTGATLNGTVNPDGVPITGCEFEYGTTTSYGQAVPCAQTPAEIGSGTSAVPVSATVTLQPDTTYHFRLVARNANGNSAGGDQVLGPPIIDYEIATGVTTTKATLQAQVNPFDTETAYHFEYGTTSGYGASVPVPDASIGSAFGDVTVSQAIDGLLPDTLYHFRVLAVNSSGPTPGPDRTFVTEPASCPNEASRQGPSAALPDCRAYEQLTPVDKGGAADLFSGSQGDLSLGSRGYSSESGDQFLLKSESSFANGVSGINIYVFNRDAQAREWGTMAVSQPSLGLQSMKKVVFDPFDFSQLAVQDQVGSTFREEHLAYHNLAGPLGGPYRTIASEPFEAGQEEKLGVAGGSSDLSHLVVASRDHQVVPSAAGLDPASDALYESVGGQERLVDLNNEGSLLSKCGAVLGQGFDVAGGTRGAVSRDGSHIVFTAPDPHGHGTGCWDGATTNPPELYMRVNGTSTLDISGEPEAGVKDPTLYPAVFAGASADGSKVFFLTKTELTADDEGAQPELYEYDTQAPEGKRLVRISRGESGNAEGSVDFVAGVSQDGSSVYFAAFGALTPGLPPLGAGQTYLYRYDTATQKTTYAASVGGREYPQNAIEQTIWYNESLPGSTLSVALNSDAEWYVAGDGRYLVFASYHHLTGYDSTAASGVHCNHLVVGTGSSENCAELFRYDAADGSIVCVSCGPPGVPPVDNALFARSYLEQGPAGGPPRPISEDGSRVFFDTASSLVPNTPSGRIHVYEWHNGTISLISSPGDPGNAFFLDSSPDGANVFFGTHAQLSPQDTDVSGDLYDARSDGGFAGLAPTACTGTGCQGVPARPPIFATPPSATFEGPGNVHQTPRCPQGKVRRHGRCVKKRHPKHRRHHTRAAKTNRRASR